MKMISKNMNHRMCHTRRATRKAGFTLIELMVSLTLFTIVVLAAVSSLYTVNSASRRVEAMRSVLDNLNFAVESMSRTIRTGTDVVCGGISNTSGAHNCGYITSFASPGTQLSVESTLGADAQVQYRWWIIDGKGRIEKQVNEGGTWSNWIALTAPEIDVQKLSFYVDGADLTDGKQPSVILILQGVATAAGDVAPFAVQTYISVRTAE